MINSLKSEEKNDIRRKMMDLEDYGRKAFSDALQQLRADYRLTQAQLANIFAIHQKTVSRYESLQAFPSVDFLLALSQYFNVSVDYLVGIANTPALNGKKLFQTPIGQIKFNFLYKDYNENTQELSGMLDYVFGLVVPPGDKKDELEGQQPWLCFKFNNQTQDLYKLIFIEKKIDYALFLLEMQNLLDFKFNQEEWDSGLWLNLAIYNSQGLFPDEKDFPAFTRTEYSTLNSTPQKIAIEGPGINRHTGGFSGVIRSWELMESTQREQLLRKYIMKHNSNR